MVQSGNKDIKERGTADKQQRNGEQISGQEAFHSSRQMYRNSNRCRRRGGGLKVLWEWAEDEKGVRRTFYLLIYLTCNDGKAI
jgi:hypothetical protein